MRSLFMELLSAKGSVDLRAWTKESIRAFEYKSYWYAGLFVVAEGWKSLKIQDVAVEALLASPNLKLLKRFRNAVFHYQENFLDERFIELIREGEKAEEWVEQLSEELRRYFQYWFDAQKNAGERLPEV